MRDREVKQKVGSVNVLPVIMWMNTTTVIPQSHSSSVYKGGN